MDVYLISSRFFHEERYQFQLKQLAFLGLSHCLIDAVLPGSLSISTQDQYWKRWQRPMRDVECAILQSHQIAWNSIVKTNKPALVIEDDILLANNIARFLNSLKDEFQGRMIILETRGRKKLFSIKASQKKSLRLLHQNKSGAAAYVLWPQAARQLLRVTAKRGLLADAALCSLKGKGIYQAVPPLALQADCCERYGLKPPFILNSSVLSVAKPDKTGYPLWMRLRWKLNRVMGQISIGITFIKHMHSSEYAEPIVNPSDFMCAAPGRYK